MSISFKFTCRDKRTHSSSKLKHFISYLQVLHHKVLPSLLYIKFILHLIEQKKILLILRQAWACTSKGTLTSLLAPWKLFHTPIKIKQRTEEYGSWWAWGAMANLLLISVTLILAD